MSLFEPKANKLESASYEDISFWYQFAEYAKHFSGISIKFYMPLIDFYFLNDIVFA